MGHVRVIKELMLLGGNQEGLEGGGAQARG